MRFQLILRWIVSTAPRENQALYQRTNYGVGDMAAVTFERNLTVTQRLLNKVINNGLLFRVSATTVEVLQYR